MSMSKSNSSIARKVTTAKSAKDLNTTAVNIALDFAAESLLLVDIQLNGPLADASINSTTEVVAGGFGRETQYRLIGSQLPNLFERSQKPERFLLPAIWNDDDDKWVDVGTNKNSDFDKVDMTKEQSSVGLFVAAGSQRLVGFILLNATKVDRHEELDRFHSSGLRLISQVIATSVQHKEGSLNSSERNCLVWSACGKTSFEIGRILSLSEHTVNHYFSIAASKLGANNRTHAVAKAIQLGLISLDEVT